MKIPHPVLSALALLATVSCARADTETIVCLRHGEKPPVEIGQLDLRGLNRSLALPNVLLAKFGKPQFIFAPDPGKQLVGKNGKPPFYDYVRPLATIEPTAILLDLPVNTSFSYAEIGGLEAELLKPAYRKATVFVSWEHGWEAKFAKKIVADLGGSPSAVPDWPSKDFDSLYVIRIERDGSQTTVSFTHDREGLDGMSDRLPSPALPAPPAPPGP